MLKNLDKWLQTMKISMIQLSAYRLNLFLQIIGPALVFFCVKYFMWGTVYSGKANLIIEGFSLKDMITYHVWALIVGIISQGHSAMNLSEDIRLGRISTFLIYPFNFWEFHTASFLAFQFIQFGIAVITLIIVSSFGMITIPALSILGIAISYIFFVSMFWFVLQYLTGLLSFWLEETWILRVSLIIITNFLSGSIVPLDLFPRWIAELLSYTPFPYLTYYPIQMLMGKYTNYSQAFIVVMIWIVALALLNKYIWRKGVKLYTAAGM